VANTSTKRKSAAERKAEKASSSKGRLFKYMGTAHVRTIEKGDTFGNHYPDGIEDKLEWNVADGHLVDSSDHPEVSDEAWDLLSEEPGFLEVTGRKTMPRGAAEDLWAPKSETPNLVAPGGVAGEGGSVGGGGPSAFGNVSGTDGGGSGVTGDASTS
jgi:hypothetical protein